VRLENNTKQKELFASLQVGRAIAAVLVVFFHNAGSIFAKNKYWGVDPSQHFFDFGHSGVEFFFVLSGFIIAHVHWNDLGCKQKLQPYLLSRFLRIYPLYWIILFILIPVYFVYPAFGNGFERDISTILSSISLLHFSSGFTIIPVAWTLYHEILFYFFFSLAIINKRWGLIILSIWLIGSATQLAIPQAPTENEFDLSPLGFYLSPLHLLFAIGVFTSLWLRRNHTISTSIYFALVGTLLFFIAAMEENYIKSLPGNFRSLVYGSSSALAIVGFVGLERQGKLWIPNICRLVGDASYAIYLTHSIVLSFIAKIFIYFGFKESFPIAISFLFLALLAIYFGLLIHLFVEKPILKLCKTFLLTKST